MTEDIADNREQFLSVQEELEEQELLQYATFYFPQNKEDHLHSNIRAVQLHRDTEEEQVTTALSEETLEDSSALYSTVNTTR